MADEALEFLRREREKAWNEGFKAGWYFAINGKKKKNPYRKKEEKKASLLHVTRTNPSGSVQQCDRRDVHEPHEWQSEFGAYFDVYCPGNDGKRR